MTVNVFFFSKISSNFIYQAEEIWFVRLYQKMIEIYKEKLKLRKLVYRKEIWRVEAGFNEKKNNNNNVQVHFYFSIGNK